MGPSPGHQTFVKQQYDQGIVDGFWLYVPAHYQHKKKYPIILFLTGGRTAATSNFYDARDHGPSKFLGDAEVNYSVRAFLQDSFLIVNPHMKVGGVEARQWNQYSKELIYALHQVDRDFPVDWDRVYLTGISRGAHGAWGVAKDYPDYFAAIAPLAGQLNCKLACEAIDWIPKWLFHGDKDQSIDINYSWEIIHRMESQGINFHHYKDLNIMQDDLNYPFLFTQFDGRGHDIWDDVYADPHFYQWLLKQKVSQRE